MLSSIHNVIERRVSSTHLRQRELRANSVQDVIASATGINTTRGSITQFPNSTSKFTLHSSSSSLTAQVESLHWSPNSSASFFRPNLRSHSHSHSHGATTSSSLHHTESQLHPLHRRNLNGSLYVGPLQSQPQPQPQPQAQAQQRLQPTNPRWKSTPQSTATAAPNRSEDGDGATGRVECQVHLEHPATVLTNIPARLREIVWMLGTGYAECVRNYVYNWYTYQVLWTWVRMQIEQHWQWYSATGTGRVLRCSTLAHLVRIVET
uniref:Uncharacterized protein n=1 Tax=Lygus hesperus TaxID=30085 RepID=A0A0A9X582_LYGHE